MLSIQNVVTQKLNLEKTYVSTFFFIQSISKFYTSGPADNFFLVICSSLWIYLSCEKLKNTNFGHDHMYKGPKKNLIYYQSQKIRPTSRVTKVYRFPRSSFSCPKYFRKMAQIATFCNILKNAYFSTYSKYSYTSDLIVTTYIISF